MDNEKIDKRIGNKFAEGKGRPIKYKGKEHDDLVYNYCLLGATDKQLATFIGVCESTIDNWKNEHESFLGALRAGKENADMKVAASLYNSCIGTKVKKQREVKVKRIDPETLKQIEVVEIVDLIEELPGDVNAIKFWLTNRQKDKWSNKTDITTNGNDVTEPKKISIKIVK